MLCRLSGTVDYMLYISGQRHSICSTGALPPVTIASHHHHIRSHVQCHGHETILLQVIKLDHDFGTAVSGVLADGQARVLALWGSYSEQASTSILGEPARLPNPQLPCMLVSLSLGNPAFWLYIGCMTFDSPWTHRSTRRSTNGWRARQRGLSPRGWAACLQQCGRSPSRRRTGSQPVAQPLH